MLPTPAHAPRVAASPADEVVKKITAGSGAEGEPYNQINFSQLPLGPAGVRALMEGVYGKVPTPHPPSPRRPPPRRARLVPCSCLPADSPAPASAAAVGAAELTHDGRDLS